MQERTDLQSNSDGFPEHLRDYYALVEHIDSQLDGLPPGEKGDRFARLVRRIVPQTNLGSDFQIPELREVKTHDKGVDLIAKGKDGQSILFIQAKKLIASAKDIREVLEGFNEFLRESLMDPELASDGQYQLFRIEDQLTPHCLLLTLSRIKGIREKYERRPSTTKELYEKLKKEGRIHFIDGEDILAIVQAAYRKISQLPFNLVLNLETDFARKDNVLMGIISSEELKRLYDQFGDALFFENVRDFLGVQGKKRVAGRTTPNLEIVKTITECPGKMLERNNGIVIRADTVKSGESARQLILTRGSVVNGCQTTMCIIDYAEEPCSVPVKIVQTSLDDSWDITKAANYQNEIPEIDLEIARNLRPQLLKRYGFISGVEVEHGKKSAFQILDEIYETRITYDETRLLYIAIFSRTPNNVFATNYTELIADLMNLFYLDDPYGHDIFRTLLALQVAAQEGKERVSEIFTDAKLYERYYEPDTPVYRCFVSVLALCGAIGMNIADRVQTGPYSKQHSGSRLDLQAEYERMRVFLRKAEDLLEDNRKEFFDYYIAAFNVWMREIGSVSEDDAEIRQRMYSRTKVISFKNAYTQLRNDVITMRAFASSQET